MKKIQVFISSTVDEQISERNALIEKINENTLYKSAHSEEVPPNTTPTAYKSIEMVSESHIYVGIFKELYGTVPKDNNPKGYSVTHMEYNEAARLGIPILILINKNADRDKIEFDLEQFLEQVKNPITGHWAGFFSSTDELLKLVLAGIDSTVTDGFIKRVEQRKNQMKRKPADEFEAGYYKRQMGEVEDSGD